MSEPTAQRHSSSHAIRSATASALTEVEVTWIEKRYEQWIRFGRIAADTIINRRTRVIAFRPGAVFAFVRWTSNDYGTIHSCIDIVTAVAPGEAYTTLPFVRPGADIDAVEAAGLDPCDASPDHWRHVGNRLNAGMPFRAYTAERHAAWLRRKALEA